LDKRAKGILVKRHWCRLWISGLNYCYRELAIFRLEINNKPESVSFVYYVFTGRTIRAIFIFRLDRIVLWHVISSWALFNFYTQKIVHLRNEISCKEQPGKIF